MSKKSRNRYRFGNRPINQRLLTQFEHGDGVWAVPESDTTGEVITSETVRIAALRDITDGRSQSQSVFEHNPAELVISGWGELSSPSEAHEYWGDASRTTTRYDFLREIAAPVLAYCVVTRATDKHWFKEHEEIFGTYSPDTQRILQSVQETLVDASGSRACFSGLSQPVPDKIAISMTARSGRNSAYEAYRMPARLVDYSQESLEAYLEAIRSRLPRSHGSRYEIGEIDDTPAADLRLTPLR